MSPELTADLAREREAFVQEHGPWTSHNIHLGNGVYTIGPRLVGPERASRQIFQTVSDLVERPMSELRVLDLACLEGFYGMEFALHGARVVGIEGRATSVEKTQFARDALGLGDRFELHVDDVRNLSIERYGRFDVVLCLGILYHLPFVDALQLLANVHAVCNRVAVFHTQISNAPVVEREHAGRRYWGRTFLEYPPGTSESKKAKALWGALDNETSWWFTRPSLMNALSDVGFTSVLECLVPVNATRNDDFVPYVAVKGTRQKQLASPVLDERPVEPAVEKAPRREHPGQRWYYSYMRRYQALVPRAVRGRLRGLLGMSWSRPSSCVGAEPPKKGDDAGSRWS